MISIINRHCKFSEISANKENPKWFDREIIFLNLVKEVTGEDIRFYIFFDGEDLSGHFLQKYKDDYEFIFQKCGSGAASFIGALEFAATLDSDFFYFVEDDYVHKGGWLKILKEGLGLGADYVTLYDHPDKYNLSMYNPGCNLFVSNSSHWRSTPSTTDTFACSKDTLVDDMDILKKYSSNTKISRDHDRFIALNGVKKTLISSIPGYSSHSVLNYESPTREWESEL